jgi:hypothetical protein
VVKRILRYKVMPWVSLVVGLLLTIFIIAMILLHTDFFARSSGAMFSRYLFHDTPFTLSVDHVSGNPLKELSIENLLVRYKGEDFSFDLIRIEEVKVSFSLWDIFSEAPSVQNVVLMNPRIWIKPDSTGANILPGQSSERPSSGFPDFTIGGFSIIDGQLIFQGKERADALRDIDLDGMISSSQGAIDFSVSKGTAESLTRSVVLRNMSGQIRWKGSGASLWELPGQSPVLEFIGLRVELEESSLIFNGEIETDSTRFDLLVDAHPLDIEEIARALESDTGHFGELQGSFTMRGTPDSVRVEGTLSGIFSGYALSELDVDITALEDRIEIARAAGGFNGALVTGSGSYTYADPEILTLDMDVRNMDLSEGFAPGRDLPETLFNGRLILEYWNADGSVMFDAEMEEGHLREIPFDRAVIKGSYKEEILDIERALLAGRTHTIDAHGVFFGEDTLQLYIDAQCQAEDTLFGYLGIEEYRSDFQISGVIEGSFDFWNWRSNGKVQNFTYRNAHVDSGEIKLFVDSGESYRVLFDLAGDSCTIDKAAFSGVDVSLEYYDGKTNIKRFHLERPGFDCEARGEVLSSDDLTEIHVGDAAVETLNERWVSSGDFRVLMTDSLLTFDDLQFHSKLGALYLNCKLNRGSEKLVGALAFNRLSLDLLNHAGLLETPLAGRAAGVIACDGSTSDPDLRFDISMEDGQIDTMIVDELRLRAGYANAVIDIDTLSASSRNGEFGLNAEVRGIDISELYERRADALRDALVEAEISCVDLNLKPFLAAIAGLPLSDGSLTGTVTLSDSLVHPSAAIDGIIENLESEYIVIPSISLRAFLDRDRIDLGGNVILSAAQQGTFQGRVPLMKGYWFYRLDSDAPLSLQLLIPKGRLEEFPELTEHIAEANGEFSADFRVVGTARNPDITGKLTLSDAGFRLAGMDERFYDVNAEILLDKTLMTVSRLEGREGKEGEFKCAGTISLEGWKPDRYDLTIDAKKFLVSSITDVLVLLTGRIEVGTVVQDGRSIPMLTGQLTVNSAEIYYDLSDFTDGGSQATMSAPTWLAEIDLDVPGNAWIKTDEARVELEGEITIHHDNRGTYLRGTLQLVRGWYNVYNNKFRVRDGSFEFVRAGSFRPVIDIEAETRDPEGRNIYLKLEWYPDDIEPRLALTHEDPGYSETDIWKMLGGGIVDSQNGQSTSWDAQRTAQNLAANYIENMLNAQMGDVTIELESRNLSSSSQDSPGESQTMIAIGKYLSEGLYVKYKQGLSISSAMEIEVEYRISRLFLIRSQIIRYSEKAFEGKSQQSTDEINLDIKMRWEF